MHSLELQRLLSSTASFPHGIPSSQTASWFESGNKQVSFHRIKSMHCGSQLSHQLQTVCEGLTSWHQRVSNGSTPWQSGKGNTHILRHCMYMHRQRKCAHTAPLSTEQALHCTAGGKNYLVTMTAPTCKASSRGICPLSQYCFTPLRFKETYYSTGLCPSLLEL